MPGRLDQLLVHHGHFASREQAKRSIMAGLVFVDGQRIDKAGSKVTEDAEIEVRGGREPYASRAGRKLEQALDRFAIDVADAVCLDVGASTGGFTDCLLQRGARRVYAVDVGYGQLVHQLRTDPRVVVMERINARHLAADAIPEPADLITVDVSFISLRKVVPALVPHLAGDGAMVTLIKPQFEAERSQVGKGGLIRDADLRREIVERCVRELSDLGLDPVDEPIDCEVAGATGNREVLACWRRPSQEANERGGDE